MCDKNSLLNKTPRIVMDFFQNFDYLKLSTTSAILNVIKGDWVDGQRMLLIK